MVTEAKLKKQVSTEIIKKMCAFADGFTYKLLEVNTGVIKDYVLTPINIEPEIRPTVLKENAVLFPLLIHRAISGINDSDKFIVNKKTQEGKITIKINYFSLSLFIKPNAHNDNNPEGFVNNVLFKNYQTDSLTQCECAMLHCLLYVLTK